MSASRRFVVLVAVAMLATGPVLWVVTVQGLPEFSEAEGVLQALGRLSGILGLAWLLLALMLSVRFPGFDALFGGLLKLWRLHHVLGAGSFLLLLLHPVLLTLASAPDGPAVTLAILTPPFEAWPIWAGWAALLVMMTFMAPTFSFFGPPKYQRWKTMHRLSGLAGALGVAHALPLAQALPAAQASALWLGYGALALAAFVWRLGLSRWVSRKRYVISRVEPLARGVVELTLEGPRLDYAPAQFVYLSPLDPALGAGRGEEHPYSLVSAPEEPVLRIAIKNLGDASGALMNVAEGSAALVEGPYGQFLPEHPDAAAVWVGGGIGITPFVSAARAFEHRGGPRDVHLIYCANDPSRAYYLPELAGIAERVGGFTVHPHYFADEGPLSLEFLETRVPGLGGRRFYACGPMPLLDLVETLAERAGIDKRDVITEEFDLL